MDKEENGFQAIESDPGSGSSDNRVDNLSTRILLLMAVLIPYLALIGYSISVYPGLPDELGIGLPKAMIFLPAFIAIILPATYGLMVFFFAHYLRKAHLIAIAALMDTGTFGLIGAVYLIKSSA